ACQFIKENNVSGKMFNYWTEGGFIAWGQGPDPNTGKTPLRLFMDGRAQAAYNYRAYQGWSALMFGGQIVREATIRKRKLTVKDYDKIAKWLDEELTKDKVWVVLMPANQFNKPFVKAIEHHSKWQLVFLNDKQKLFIDTRTPQGKKLFDGIANGKTIYPDEYHRKLILAHNLFFFATNDAAKSQGVELAIQAFDMVPSRTPLQMIKRYYDRNPALRARILEFFQGCFDEFIRNRKQYNAQHGIHHRIIAALMATDHLQPMAAREKDTEKIDYYKQLRKELSDQLKSFRDKRW
ncbi:unnamed protein product, partial [marine sediment metagenome]